MIGTSCFSLKLLTSEITAPTVLQAEDSAHGMAHQGHWALTNSLPVCQNVSQAFAANASTLNSNQPCNGAWETTCHPLEPGLTYLTTSNDL